MFREEQFVISDLNSSDRPLTLLKDIFRRTLKKDISDRAFYQYYFSQHPDQLDVTLLYDGSELVGFCSAAFYPRKIEGEKVIICRSALGLLKSVPKGQFPLHRLFAKYIAYKLRHPFTPVFITGFMANPLMYAMICKYTREVYPKKNVAIPPRIETFKSALMEQMRLSKSEIRPFVMKIHFQVQFTEAEKQSFRENPNPDVQHFLSINPGFDDQYGVLVLLPVSYSNMLYTVCKYAWVRSLRWMRKSKGKS